MAGKFENQKKKKKKSGRKWIPVLIALAVLVISTVLLLMGRQAPAGASAQKETTRNLPQESQGEALPEIKVSDYGPLLQQNGILVQSIQSYTGAYLEDGSDELVSDVLAIVVKNNSGQALQYAQITISFPEGDARFSISTLPADKEAVLLEESRMAFTSSEPQDLLVENVALLPEFELYADTFRISGMDGVLNVKNISDQDISGTISVYYKNKIQDRYYGGITYRARIEGGLEADEIRQIPTKHFHPDNCEILMVTCAG